jgi:hypothetical protein
LTIVAMMPTCGNSQSAGIIFGTLPNRIQRSSGVFRMTKIRSPLRIDLFVEDVG